MTTTALGVGSASCSFICKQPIRSVAGRSSNSAPGPPRQVLWLRRVELVRLLRQWGPGLKQHSAAGRRLGSAIEYQRACVRSSTIGCPNLAQIGSPPALSQSPTCSKTLAEQAAACCVRFEQAAFRRSRGVRTAPAKSLRLEAPHVPVKPGDPTIRRSPTRSPRPSSAPARQVCADGPVVVRDQARIPHLEPPPTSGISLDASLARA